MPQINSRYTETRTDFGAMSFSPDIPTTNLDAKEYNSGANVETDVRGIRTVLGEQEILSTITGTPVYVTGGYRDDGDFYYIVAAVSNTTEGRWYQISATGTQTNITPGYNLNPTAYLTGYSTDVNITEAWNGTTVVINDGIHAPMFYTGGAAEFTQYKNNATMTVTDMYFSDSTTIQCEFNGPINIQYQLNERMRVSDVVNPIVWNGIYTAVNQPSYSIVELQDTAVGVGTWYGTGSVTAGVLTVTTTTQGTLATGLAIVGDDPDWALSGGSPTTITADLGGGQWQLSDNVTTTINPDNMVAWQPFVSGGTARPEYQWNYNPEWSSLTAGFIRAFQSPNVGTILIAGNLTAEDFTTPTATQYNFPTTVRWSQNFGINAVPETWEPSLSNVANELEVPVRGAVLDGFPCNGNFFVASYWDTAIFSPIAYQTTQIPILGVRLYNQGRGLLQANCWANSDDLVYGIDARDLWVFDGQRFNALGNQRVKNWFFSNLNTTMVNKVFVEVNTQRNQAEYYFPSTASTGFCDTMLSYRYDLNCFNAPRTVPSVIMACEAPRWVDATPDYFNPGSRCVSFVRAVASSKICQKDTGTSFVNAAPIAAVFRRDGIHLGSTYSNLTMVHRLLPELNTLNAAGLQTTSTGSVSIRVGGANSAGEAYTFKQASAVDIDTTRPWYQVNQNVYRLNSVEVSTTSTTLTWILSAATWQYTETEDDR